MNLPSTELVHAAWTQVWQLTLLIAVVALLARVFARNRPHLAHVLWLVVLLKCVTPPLLSSPSGLFCWMQAGGAETVSIESQPSGPIADIPNNPLPILPPADAHVHVVAELKDRSEPVATEPTEAGQYRWASVLMVVWLCGTIAMLGITAVRWMVCLGLLWRAGLSKEPAYDRLLNDLARRLKLWQPVRLVVTKSRVGPAVVGMVRPTVLLPEIIVKGKSAEQLEPILAHELIHVRRGDTWIGALTMLARAVWWFHPLVWWTGRMVSREAERCCDEAVLAELGCSPSGYARSLLEVLQRKQSLQPVPAFPGVRPVEVTSRRMERIMRLGQGSQRRSPWWCWAVMLLAVVVTLPGAALVGAADEKPEEATEPQALVPAVSPPTVVSQEKLSVRAYQVDDILTKICTDPHVTREVARDKLLSEFLRTTPGITWSGEELVAQCTEADHSRIAAVLETLRTHGLSQIMIHATIVEGPSELIDSLYSDWMPVPTNVSTAGAPEGRAMKQYAPRIAHEPFPVKSNNVLDEKRVFEVVAQLRKDGRLKVLAEPTLVTVNGRPASFASGNERPFLVGMKDGKPQTRLVWDGTKMNVNPRLIGPERVRLAFRLTLSKIRGVETKTISNPASEEPVTLQIPKVETVEMTTSAELVLGQTLLLRGLEKKVDRGGTQSLLVMLRATKVVPDRPPVAASPLPAQTYSAAADKSERATVSETVVPVEGPPKVDTQKKLSDRTYHVGDVLTTICNEYRFSRKAARDTLLSELPRITSGIRWSGEELVAQCTEADHSRIAAVLETLRTHGLSQITIQGMVVEGPPELIDAFLTAQPMDSLVAEAQLIAEAQEDSSRVIERPLANKQVAQHTYAGSIVRKNLPMMFGILNEKLSNEVLGELRKDPRLKVLAAPAIVTRNGWSASIVCPLVVRMKDGKPQTRIVEESLTMNLVSHLLGRKRLRLECRLKLSKIRGVEITPISIPASEEPVTLQIPEVESTEVDTAVEMALGQTLWIGGLKRKDDKGDTQKVLVMLQATKVGPPERPSMEASKRRPVIR